jgi:Na+-transporting methylmalonyl-CoA/oxaloacetate decarboxylase gamma subunit
MAEDEDRPEDDIEDEDDSDLFEPPSVDPLGDALAEAAAAGEDVAAPPQESEEQEEDDSDLFEPPLDAVDEPVAEAPEPGGHQPVLPVVEEDIAVEEESADLFDAPDSTPDGADEDAPEEDEEPARQRYPWLQRSEEEEEPEEEEHSLQGRTLIFVGAGVVFVIFSALIWFLYSTGDEVPGDQDVALIEAPEGPAKVAPEDRGGMEVADQDKLVFDRVSGQETPMEEKLLAGPEEPIALPESAPESLPESLDELVDALLDEEDSTAISATADTSAGTPVAEAAPVEAAPVAAAPVETAPPPAPQPVAASGTHVVQLGAYGSAERAETGWLVVKNRHSILLAGLGNDIQRADLGARGVFYRLRTEALALEEARDLCVDLKAAGQDCLVVQR